MELFFFNINKNEDGIHEVHTSSCPTPPAKESQVFIGQFETSVAALEAAKLNYPTMNFKGCTQCCSNHIN